MAGSAARAALRSTPLLGLALFLFSAAFPLFDDVAEVDLTLHMLQHVLLVLAGVLVAYPVFRSRAVRPRKWAAWASLLSASALIMFWHLPVPWDSAVLNPGIHALEHLSFFGVGLFVGSWVVQLSDSAKIGALMAAFFGHMGYAFALIAPWTGQVYRFYSVADQNIAGWTLLLTGPSLVVGVAYLLARNPAWLGGFSGEGSKSGRRETVIDRMKVPTWVAPLLTGALVLVALIYFGATVFAIGGLPGGGATTVQISETPISWQYSPQQIRVVLGVNNTVTWASRSISYDSVTSRTGAFDSGPIPPGGSFTFTFEAPGAYYYYCVYHPWMTGEVVVVARGSS
ncbi:MAG TPA: DUF1404 family protein [Nitrososphaerales archaeon]|nr:DUF1404 family protein [Nitrososphaerales archaeon]